jgi:predicted nucleic acid-binding protein
VSRVIIDASVAFSWIMATQLTRSAEALRALANAEFAAPYIFGFELRNGLLRAERQKRLSRAAADLAVADLLGDVVRLDDPPDADILEATLGVARMHGLSYYDACYLELALRAHAQLASRDGPLLDAAARMGAMVYDAR